MTTDAKRTTEQPDNQLFLAGQILQVSKIDGAQSHPHEHLIVLPAPDAYTSPAVVRVRADRRIGVKGEEVRVLVRPTGFRRMFNLTDRETGEISRRTTAETYFVVIEE